MMPPRAGWPPRVPVEDVGNLPRAELARQPTEGRQAAGTRAGAGGCSRPTVPVRKDGQRRPELVDGGTHPAELHPDHDGQNDSGRLRQQLDQIRIGHGISTCGMSTRVFQSPPHVRPAFFASSPHAA